MSFQHKVGKYKYNCVFVIAGTRDITTHQGQHLIAVNNVKFLGTGNAITPYFAVNLRRTF